MNNKINTEARKPLQELLDHDHDWLDELYQQFHRVKNRDPEQARAYLNQFSRGLLAHIDWEEEALFPYYEQRIDPLGLTRDMRVEHRAIRLELEKLQKTLGTESDPYTRCESRLRTLLDRHNQKEEEQLYPELNQFLSGEEKQKLKKQFERRLNQ